MKGMTLRKDARLYQILGTAPRCTKTDPHVRLTNARQQRALTAMLHMPPRSLANIINTACYEAEKGHDIGIHRA